jgi:hypothetical protein
VAIAIYSLPQTGAQWHAVGGGLNGSPRALAFDTSDNLYVGEYGVYKWDGSNWSLLGATANHYTVLTLALGEGSDLYAGGDFTSIGGISANKIAKWDGSAWSKLNDEFFNFFVLALKYDSVNNILYAGGDIFVRGVTSPIFKYDGSSWTTWGNGGGGGNVSTLIFDKNNKLYAGGSGWNISGVWAPTIARWTGSTWEAIGDMRGEPAGGNPEPPGSVSAMAYDPVHDILYAGGLFISAGGVAANNVAKWNGSSWEALGNGINGEEIYALAYDYANDILYAGGSFTSAGGVPAYNIAKWNGTSWEAIGVGMDSVVYALAVDSHGNLYAAGSFTIAGDVIANHIARWGN